jgi:hypothetical protein
VKRRNTYEIWMHSIVDIVHLEDGNMGGRTVLKLMLGKRVVRMSWTGLAQETGRVTMSCADKPFWFHSDKD